MQFLLNLFIFLIILFIYIHLVAQFKKSQDLEIYEMDYKDNAHLQEVCDMKQPVLFEFESVQPRLFNSLDYPSLHDAPNFDVKLKDTYDYFGGVGVRGSVNYIVLPFQSAFKLIDTDVNKHFMIEGNNDYVEESPYYDIYRSCDAHFKPAFTGQTKYDLFFGSRGTYTPMRYHTCYRQFLSVNSGKIHVKMTPWRSYKYLHPYHDYEEYEFVSPVDPWAPQAEYVSDYQKVKFLEFQVSKGFVLYVPPYWFYSIKYEEDTVCSGFVYNSVMNMVSNVPHYARYYLQQGVKKKVLKQLDNKYTTSDVYVYDKADINSGPVVDETQQTSMVDSLLNKNI